MPDNNKASRLLPPTNLPLPLLTLVPYSTPAPTHPPTEEGHILVSVVPCSKTTPQAFLLTYIPLSSSTVPLPPQIETRKPNVQKCMVYLINSL